MPNFSQFAERLGLTLTPPGYKWLKYIPASLIKTAQTAEWKMQGWKIGKPPTIAWEGIGFDVNSVTASLPSTPTSPATPTSGNSTIAPLSPRLELNYSQVQSQTQAQAQAHAQSQIQSQVPEHSDAKGPRPSFTSSEYDDLADFNGRYGSTTSLAKGDDAHSMHPRQPSQHSQSQASQQPVVKKKASFLGLFEGRQRRQNSITSMNTTSRPATSRSDSAPPTSGASPNGSPGLRGSKSKSSLRSRASVKYNNSMNSGSAKSKSTPPLPDLPVGVLAREKENMSLPPLPISEDMTLQDLGFVIPALDGAAFTDWDITVRGAKAKAAPAEATTATAAAATLSAEANPRANGKRSISLSPGGGVGLRKTQLALPAFSMSVDTGPPSPTFSQASVAAPSIFSARSGRSARSNASSSVRSSPYSAGLASSVATSTTSGTSTICAPTSTTTAAAAKESQKPGGITLASALMQASHAEALKGGTADLLSILERPDSRPWGFSYTDVKQHVKVWYGDRDERIGISSVRWMERAMRDCEVKILKGEDHGLLTNAKVVVEVLESVAGEW